MSLPLAGLAGIDWQTADEDQKNAHGGSSEERKE